MVSQSRHAIWLRLLVILVLTAGLTFAGKISYGEYVFAQNKGRINDLGRQTITGAELMVDYAVITLSDLAAAGLVRCDSESLLKIRRMVYLRGAVKDVQVLGPDDKFICAGLPQSKLLGYANFDLSAPYFGNNAQISLHVLDEESVGLVGIAWRFGPKLALLAILNVDSLLFDVFPAELRDSARATLLLGETRFAQFTPIVDADAPMTNSLMFNSTSDRYPITVRFELDEQLLRGWDKDYEAIVVSVIGVFSLITSVLFVGVMFRPENRVQELRNALRKGEIVPFMQPTFSILDGRIVGCEVLARWIKPDGTVIPPQKFIPDAEENDLIVPMTRVLMRAALVQLKAPLADGKFKVAFNVVASDLMAEGFVHEICEIADSHGVNRNQLVLELTERQAFNDTGLARKVIESLRANGFQVALDDTGTGHNGLTNVRELGASIIKIDKHFIDLVGQDKAGTTIVQMLVRLGLELGMTTVAEGIEDERQWQALRECGVDLGQGYIVSPPVAIAEFLDLVEEKNTAHEAEVNRMPAAG